MIDEKRQILILSDGGHPHEHVLGVRSLGSLAGGALAWRVLDG